MVFHDFSVSEDNCDRYLDDFEQILFNFDKNLIFLEKLFHSVAKNVFLWKFDTLGMSGRNIAGNIFLMKIFIFPEFSVTFVLGGMPIFEHILGFHTKNLHPPTQMWPEILEKMKIFIKKIFPPILRPHTLKVLNFH